MNGSFFVVLFLIEVEGFVIISQMLFDILFAVVDDLSGKDAPVFLFFIIFFCDIFIIIEIGRKFDIELRIIGFNDKPVVDRIL